MKLQSKRS
jgi:hypothetical protein